MSFAGLRTKLEAWLHRQWLKRGVWAWSTAPLALIFGLILKLRRYWYTHNRDTLFPNDQRHDQNDVHAPVLIVGNIYVGGTGKTPIVIELVKALRERGWHPGVISRGYGASIGENPLVGQGVLNANHFGDEPAVIAIESNAPIAVHPDRLLAYNDLLKHFPEVNLVISDDGLQHLQLKRNIELVVQDSRRTGNGWLLPAGPLREPVSRLQSVDGILTREDQLNPALSPQEPGSVRTSNISLEITGFKNLLTRQLLDPKSFISETKGKTIAGVAGVARPERFFNDLHTLGLSLAETLALPDHFPFEQSTFLSLKSEYVIVTLKDAVKLGTLDDPRIWVAETKIRFSDPEFINWLDQALRKSNI